MKKSYRKNDKSTPGGVLCYEGSALLRAEDQQLREPGRQRCFRTS